MDEEAVDGRIRNDVCDDRQGKIARPNPQSASGDAKQYGQARASQSRRIASKVAQSKKKRRGNECKESSPLRLQGIKENAPKNRFFKAGINRCEHQTSHNNSSQRSRWQDRTETVYLGLDGEMKHQQD